MSQGKGCQFTLVKKLNEAPTLGEEHLALINGLSFHGPAIVQRGDLLSSGSYWKDVLNMLRVRNRVDVS